MPRSGCLTCLLINSKTQLEGRIKFLRAFAEEVIKERQEALQRGDETPPDILAHLLIKRRRNRTQTSQWKLWWMILLLSLWQVSALHLVFWVRTLLPSLRAAGQGCISERRCANHSSSWTPVFYISHLIA